MAAGIIALALEANPLLTWRDVQHIIVLTSRPLNLKAPDWKKNALGRSVSHSYGYGLMDASAMVKKARNWKLMPVQNECLVTSPYYYKIIPAMGYITIELEVNDCPGIKYLEHVSIWKVYIFTYFILVRLGRDFSGLGGTRSSWLRNRLKKVSCVTSIPV